MAAGSWRTARAAWPPLRPENSLVDRRATALVMVDMQNAYANPDYGYGPLLLHQYPEIAGYYYPRLRETVIPNIGQLLDTCRSLGVRVIHITTGPTLPDGSDFLPVRRQISDSHISSAGARTLGTPGSPEHRMIPELSPESGELVINKLSRGAFNSTALDQVLRNMGVETLIVCGVATNACVETTARDAADRGYSVYLIDDACATFDQDSHDATLVSFHRLFGEVMLTAEMVNALQAAPGQSG